MDLRYFVITGGPGSGKTTLIQSLSQKGYRCVEEAARSIIKQQIEIGGSALPWENLEKFKKIVFEKVLQDYQKAEQCKGVVFFDRGILDLVAYSRLMESEVPIELSEAVNKHIESKIAFIAPPWKKIYTIDAERKESFEQSIETYRYIVDVYNEYGYTLIDLPKTSVQNRVKFVISKIKIYTK